MKIGILMDDPKNLKPQKDSTVAMIEAAHKLGFECAYFTLNDIYCKQKKAYANVYSIEITDKTSSNWANITALGECSLSDFNIILMRKDPPFNLEYIYATYVLELAENDGVLVANKPQSLRDSNEKFFTLNFPNCCPNTIVTRDIARLRAFWEENGSVIFKPLEGMGGNSVFHVDKTGHNLPVILELLTNSATKMIMAQCYIPDIKTTAYFNALLCNCFSHRLASTHCLRLHRIYLLYNRFDVWRDMALDLPPRL